MMTSSIKQRLQNDMKTAMLAKDKQRLGVIRMMLSALKQVEIDERIELDDARVAQILHKMVKQHSDSINQYDQAKRSDLAEKERLEKAIVETYLPEPLNEVELDALIASVINHLQATSIKDMGKVVAELKRVAQGRADMGMVSQKVKKLLTPS